MAKIYYRLVIQGIWTLDQVPARWRAEVKKMIEENN